MYQSHGCPRHTTIWQHRCKSTIAAHHTSKRQVSLHMGSTQGRLGIQVATPRPNLLKKEVKALRGFFVWLFFWRYVYMYIYIYLGRLRWFAAYSFYKQRCCVSVPFFVSIVRIMTSGFFQMIPPCKWFPKGWHNTTRKAGYLDAKQPPLKQMCWFQLCLLRGGKMLQFLLETNSKPFVNCLPINCIFKEPQVNSAKKRDIYIIYTSFLGVLHVLIAERQTGDLSCPSALFQKSCQCFAEDLVNPNMLGSWSVTWSSEVHGGKKMVSVSFRKTNCCCGNRECSICNGAKTESWPPSSQHELRLHHFGVFGFWIVSSCTQTYTSYVHLTLSQLLMWFHFQGRTIIYLPVTSLASFRHWNLAPGHSHILQKKPYRMNRSLPQMLVEVHMHRRVRSFPNKPLSLAKARFGCLGLLGKPLLMWYATCGLDPKTHPFDGRDDWAQKG